MRVRLGNMMVVAGCLLGYNLAGQTVKKVHQALSAHYADRSVIREFQAGTINTETENYHEAAVAKYNALFSNYGLAGYVSYVHTGPFRHHLSAAGGKFIYGRQYTSTSSQTVVFEGMFGKNREENSEGRIVSRSVVYGLSVTGNLDYKWIGCTLGFSAGKFIPRNDENINFFSNGRFAAFDVYGRWKVRMLPHRWFFLEYSSNDLFLFHGGQGKLTQACAGTGFGLENGSELKLGYLKFLNTPGVFIESSLYFHNKYGVGVNYTLYDRGSNYTSLKVCYRLGEKRF
jgi:hypothetical protein